MLTDLTRVNILSTILALAAFGFGATSVYLYTELDGARGQTSARSALCWDERAQLAALQEAHAALGPEATQSHELLASNPEADSVECATGRLDPDVSGRPRHGRELYTELVDRKLSRTRHEAAFRRTYRGIGEELDLPPDQETELLALLLQQQLEQIEVARRFAGDRAAMASAMNDLRIENSTELMAALGDKYLQFEDYQRTLGERMQIEQAALQLEAASIPLSEEQRKDLLAVMVEERDRIPGPPWSPGVPVQEYAAQQQAWQADYEQRVRDRATRVLTSDQLKQYDVYRNLQATQRRRQFEARRESSRQSLGPAAYLVDPKGFKEVQAAPW